MLSQRHLLTVIYRFMFLLCVTGFGFISFFFFNKAWWKLWRKEPEIREYFILQRLLNKIFTFIYRTVRAQVTGKKLWHRGEEIREGELITVNISALSSQQKWTPGDVDGIGRKIKLPYPFFPKILAYIFAYNFKFRNKVHSYSSHCIQKLENFHYCISPDLFSDKATQKRSKKIQNLKEEKILKKKKSYLN